MASTYSTNLKIELQATGENSGTWGTITNTNLGTALEQAIVGYGNPNYASDANLTLTYTDTNAAQAARALVLNVTSGVSLTATRELVVPTIQKQYIVQNNTTGSQSITVKTSAGTGITVPNGRKAHLYVDGTNVIFMDDFVDINGGSIDGTTIGANSAAAGNFTTVDTTNIEVSNLKAKDGTAAGSIADSTGVVTLGSSVLTTTDINGGTIDGTTIGGSSAAAGTFTSATVSTGNLTFSSTGQRITGDFSNATLSNRLAFQTSTTNGNTIVGAFPNGTGTNARLQLFSASDPANASTASMEANATSSLVIINADKTGTGTYLPMTFYTGGSERMRLDTSGNLGVGTSSPSSVSKIDIQIGTSTSNYGLQVRSYDAGTVDGSTTARVFRTVNSGAGNWANAQYDAWSHIWTKSASSELMRLDSSGNVGIGTASPVTRLHVLDALSGGQLIVANSETNAAEKYGTFATQHYTNAQSPALGMAVQSNSTDNNILIGGALGEFNAATGIKFYTAANNTTTTGTERMRIDSSGNVGIGTASPQSKLNVVESSSSTSIGGSTAVLQVGNSYGAALNVSAGIELFGSGAPSSGLNNRSAGLYGVYEAYNASGNAGALVLATNPAGTTSVVERMRIDSSGNVGIGGTAAADTKLQLLGTYPVSGTVTRIVRANGTIPSSATGEANIFQSSPAIENAVFTLPALFHYKVAVSSFGSATVTNQYGFHVDSSLTGATNNYGFHSNIASGSNRWNFYAAGTARNYFAGEIVNPNDNTIRFGDSDSATIIGKSGASGGYIKLGANGERMRVKSEGQVRFIPLSSDPAGAEAGDVYYNSSTNKLKVYNGTSWVDLH